MNIGKQEFDKLAKVAGWLNTLGDSCTDLLEYIDNEIDFRGELSEWVVKWLERVERVCERAEGDLRRMANLSVSFLIMPRRPWRAGEDSEYVKCSGCGEARDRRLVIRKWEGEEEVILCLRCARESSPP